MKIANRLKIMLKGILDFKLSEVETDKGKLIWDGEEDLKEGDEVFVMGENDEPVAAPDGEYKTEDNKVIVVEGGIVASISDPEAEVAEESEVKQEENLDVEIVDEPEETETEEVSIEDRVAAIEARIQEIVDGLNQIINAIAGLEGRIVEVEGKLSKVEAPAAEPVDDKPEVEQNAHKSRLSYLKKN